MALRDTPEMRVAGTPDTAVAGTRGRPPSKMPPEVLERLGEPPTDDPIAMAAWLHRLGGELVWLECNGRAPKGLGARIRATMGAMVRAMPDAVRAELDARQRGGAVEDKRGQATEAVTSGSSAIRG